MNNIDNQTGPMFFFKKTRNVKTPERAHPTDAGLDIFVPEFDEGMASTFFAINPDNLCQISHDGIIVPPGASVRVPMGIHVRIPDGCAMISFNKSSVASKTGFVLGACVIDSGYTGEVIGNMLNTSNDVRKISFGQKLFQSVIIPVLFPAVEEVDAETYSKLRHEGDRGTGGFGSTGK